MLVGPYRDLFPFLRPHLGRFILALVFGALFGLISGLLPLVLNFVNSQVFPQGKNKVDMLNDAVNGTGTGINSVVLVCSVIPLIFVLRSLCDYLNSYYMAWVALRVLADIRCKLYTHILNQSLEFFNRERSGNLISRVANDTRTAQTALTSISSDLIKQPLTVISAFAVLIHLDWKFTIVSLFLFPVSMVPIVYYGKKVRRQGKFEEERIGSMMSILQESFAGIRVIKAFAREKREAENFASISDEQFKSGVRVRKAIEIVSPMVEAVSAIGVGLALFYVWYTHLSAAKFLALLAGIFMLYDPIKKLSRIHLVMQQCFNATNNIFEILKRKPAIQDAPGAIGNCGKRGRHSHRERDVPVPTGPACGGAGPDAACRARQILRPRRVERCGQKYDPFVAASILRAGSRFHPAGWTRYQDDQTDFIARTDRHGFSGNFPLSRFDS